MENSIRDINSNYRIPSNKIKCLHLETKIHVVASIATIEYVQIRCCKCKRIIKRNIEL